MPDIYTFGNCAGLSLLTWAYSLILRTRREQYQDRWTWLTVAIGVLIVALGVAVRFFLLPVPEYDAPTMLTWSWYQWMYHFAAGGAPIVWWQIDEDRSALERALKSVRARTDPAKAEDQRP